MDSFKLTLFPEDLEHLRGKSTNEEVLKALAYIDKEREWKEGLASALTERELVVWEFVASIVEKQTTDFSSTFQTLYGVDIFGFRQGSYRSGRKTYQDRVISINDHLMTQEGWERAKPIIQKALDFFRVPFDAGKSGLTCAMGEFCLETIYTDPDTNKEYHMFDMGHGASGFAGSCSPVFEYEDWFHICKFPKRTELVNVEGWRKRGNCGRPRRPREQ